MPIKPGNSEQTRIRRLADLASHSQDELFSILDENLVAHVGIVFEGAPLVIPMTYGRVGEELLLHGSSGSRLMRALSENSKVCISITELNGLKVARSTFNTGMHYRAVVIFGEAEVIADDKKDEALNLISNAILPNRPKEVRASTKKELAATLIIKVPLNNCSVKVSDGPVEDEPEDLNQGVWAGIVPIREQRLAPIPADQEAIGLEIPQSVLEFISRRPAGH